MLRRQKLYWSLPLNYRVCCFGVSSNLMSCSSANLYLINPFDIWNDWWSCAPTLNILSILPFFKQPTHKQVISRSVPVTSKDKICTVEILLCTEYLLKVKNKWNNCQMMKWNNCFTLQCVINYSNSTITISIVNS